MLELLLLSPKWTPRRLGSSLLGWWDAERTDLITQSGGLVSAWTDIVGAYSVTQATGGAKPIYSATSFNGRPGVTYDGIDDALSVAPVPAAIPIGANASELWALCDQTALAADTTVRGALVYGGGATVRRAIFRVVSTLNRAASDIGNGTTSAGSTNTSVDLSGRHVLRMPVSATDVDISVDGIGGFTAPVVPATSNTRLLVGSSSTASGFWQGVINTAIVTAPLSPAQAALLSAYLNSRK